MATPMATSVAAGVRTTAASLKDLGLPAADQVGMVVRDLDASIALYDPLFGPFHRMDGSVAAADYRGGVADVGLDLAFGRSGDLEIELIQWTSGHSPHSEFIEKGREGMHHIRFRVDDCDGWVRKLEALGYERVWGKHLEQPKAVFAYMERPGDPVLIEFLEMA
ncbi:MAG: VOC family protein [Proteobacteria bacterium]|nr:VOC family protein [Pseudomonadota bacterium]HQR02981.1 VOC family protein [Rhodocyclaceae bacterium]